MNAMNCVFVPNGLTPRVLERYFRPVLPHLLLAARRAVGAGRIMLREPRFLWRLVQNAALFLRHKSGAVRGLFRRDVPAELRPQARSGA